MSLTPPNDWHFDYTKGLEIHCHKIKRIITEKGTPFQHAKLVELELYGKSLILNDRLQSASLDEFIFHESLVHPPMTLCQNPRNIMILGGGEGATLREV